MKLNKIKMSLIVAIPLLFSSIAAEAAEAVKNSDDYSLDQVVVFSRHGLRAPLATPSSALGKVTPNQWPYWDTPASYLTTRGGALESYFGHYFNEWMVDNKLLKSDVCPTDKDVYFYANSMQRTIATAQYFAVGAFPGCLVPIVHKEEMNKMDPLFSLNLRDDSEPFKTQAIESISEQAGGSLDTLNQKLKPIYERMEQIIDYKDSANCKQDNKCDLLDDKASIKIVKGAEPGVTGPLKTGTSISDAFILQYYEGSPMKDIAWGQIASQDEFEKLVSIKEYYNTVVFSAPVIAKHVSKNLITYIDKTFTQKESPKMTFLVGHDSNVASIFSALEIKPYQLPEQFETTPIGGKVVFERWVDNKTGEKLMKIEYFYQTTEQLADMKPLTRENPPKQVVLEMKSCPINAQGFCSYDLFKKHLDSLAKN